MSLSECLKDSYSKLYFDNYFSSLALMRIENRVYACDTVGKDRKGYPVTSLQMKKYLGENLTGEVTKKYYIFEVEKQEYISLAHSTIPKKLIR